MVDTHKMLSKIAKYEFYCLANYGEYDLDPDSIRSLKLMNRMIEAMGAALNEARERVVAEITDELDAACD